jgi:ParB/RepB/Spo0J family partition protein
MLEDSHVPPFHLEQPKRRSIWNSAKPMNIIVGERHRHDLGDIGELARNIAEVGLLHPIVVRPDGTLIAGVRRLEACKTLGWQDIPVHVVELDQIARGKFSENVYRKAFLPSEIDAIRRTLDSSEKAAAKQRQREHGGTAPRRHCAKLSHSDKRKPERALEKIAAYTGKSVRHVEKIAAVCDAAEADARLLPLVAEMDRTGKVDRSYYELRRIQVEEAETIAGPAEAKIITGDFHKQGHLVADNSVDLIFTDPLYHRKDIPLYADLAKFAARVLIEGGSLICFCGHFALPEILPLMQPHLHFHWLIAVVRPGCMAFPGKFVHTGWKPLLWLKKGKRRTKTLVGDCAVSKRGNQILDHEWAKGLSETTYYIEQLSRKGSLICDPFLGGGSIAVSALKLGRGFVGFEIDPEVARKAKDRIAHLHREGGKSS